jgi:hypothetical protein
MRAAAALGVVEIGVEAASHRRGRLSGGTCRDTGRGVDRLHASPIAGPGIPIPLQEPIMTTKRATGSTPANKKKSTKKTKTVETTTTAPPAAETTPTAETKPVEPIAAAPVAAEAIPAAELKETSETTTRTEVSQRDVRRRAYAYWVAGGKDTVANWFRSENELRSEAMNGTPSSRGY